jgi:hypothetical protein
MNARADDTAALLDAARHILNEPGADADVLYRRWFHRETGRSIEWPDAAHYLAATRDPARFEKGWRVMQTSPGLAGGIVAMRGGRERVVGPPEMTPEDPRLLVLRRATPVRVDPLATGFSGGFWHVWSAGWQKATPPRLKRIYLGVEPQRALDLMSRVSATAPPRATWCVKALSGTHDAGRRDAAVLYLPQNTDLHSGWPAALLDSAALICTQGMPPFVSTLTRGIGCAPDPGGGMSFGQALCQAIASAAPHANDAGRFQAVALAAIEAMPGMQSRTLRCP